VDGRNDRGEKTGSPCAGFSTLRTGTASRRERSHTSRAASRAADAVRRLLTLFEGLAKRLSCGWIRKQPKGNAVVLSGACYERRRRERRAGCARETNTVTRSGGESMGPRLRPLPPPTAWKPGDVWTAPRGSGIASFGRGDGGREHAAGHVIRRSAGSGRASARRARRRARSGRRGPDDGVNGLHELECPELRKIERGARRQRRRKMRLGRRPQPLQSQRDMHFAKRGHRRLLLRAATESRCWASAEWPAHTPN